MSATYPPITIRPARAILADATALLAVERRSLGDSPYTPEEVLAILRRGEHYAYLALAGGRPVGFCSSFETPTDAGPRLELDMLGVHPDYRGRGIATALLRAAIAEAQDRGLCLFRGVVAADNLPSQRAFERAGLRRDALPRDLTVYEVRGDTPLPYLPEDWQAHVAPAVSGQPSAIGGWRSVIAEGTRDVLYSACLPHDRQAGGPSAMTSPIGSRKLTADRYPRDAGREVLHICDDGGHTAALAEAQRAYTLAYRGLWLERHWAATPRALLVLALGLVERARALDLDEVGYLAPPANEAPGKDDDAVTWARAGYRVVGRYYLYTAGEP